MQEPENCRSLFVAWMNSGGCHEDLLTRACSFFLPIVGVQAQTPYFQGKTIFELEVAAEKRNYEVGPVAGEDMERLAKEVMAQPPAVIDRMKKILGN